MTKKTELTTVAQATQIVLQNIGFFGNESVPIHQSTNRILQEDLIADRDFPPFNRVSMDGIGNVHARFEKGQRIFKIEGLQAAGAPQLVLEKSENCLEVMTGAILPGQADTVIRYEDLEIKDGKATILIETVKKGQNIHNQGTDRLQGALIVKKGKKISSAEIGVAATVGKSHLKVGKFPKLVIISTGDELVEVHEKPLAHQIRKSNVYTLSSTVSTWGLSADLLHLPDEKETIRNILSEALEKYDALLLSGGVSAGKLDFIPRVLEELKVEKLFHKVSQRPGKPFWFGRSASAFIFAFPGNPVSSFMCLYRYFQPWLRASLGLPAFQHQYAVLAKDFFFKPDLTYFLQIKIINERDGKTVAVPVEGKGSGDLANLVEADAFMELPRGRNEFQKGDIFPVLFYRSI